MSDLVGLITSLQTSIIIRALLLLLLPLLPLLAGMSFRPQAPTTGTSNPAAEYSTVHTSRRCDQDCSREGKGPTTTELAKLSGMHERGVLQVAAAKGIQLAPAPAKISHQSSDHYPKNSQETPPRQTPIFNPNGTILEPERLLCQAHLRTNQNHTDRQRANRSSFEL